MTSDETPAAECPKGSACGWKERARPIMGIVFWMIIGALVFNALLPKKPQQQWLAITNTGSQSVDIRKLARWSWDEEDWTLHPGATVWWKFANGAHFRIARSDQAPPQPGTTPSASPTWTSPPTDSTSPLGGLVSPLPSRSHMWGSDVHHNADGSGTIILRHVDRTAEVRVNEAGEIEFEFTDL